MQIYVYWDENTNRLCTECCHIITETDCRQRDERIVYRIRVRPILNVREHKRRYEYEENQPGYQIHHNSADHRESHGHVVFGRRYFVHLVAIVYADKLCISNGRKVGGVI